MAQMDELLPFARLITGLINVSEKSKGAKVRSKKNVK
jgi:hypothetical protein